MFHTIEADEGSSATETGFAVDCDRTCVVFLEVVLTGGQKLLHDVLRRCRAVNEYHFVVSDSLLFER